jgi:hypothetical protein
LFYSAERGVQLEAAGLGQFLMMSDLHFGSMADPKLVGQPCSGEPKEWPDIFTWMISGRSGTTVDFTATDHACTEPRFAVKTRRFGRSSQAWQLPRIDLASLKQTLRDDSKRSGRSRPLA